MDLFIYVNFRVRLEVEWEGKSAKYITLQGSFYFDPYESYDVFLSFGLVASQPWTSPWQFLDAKWLSTWKDSGRIEELKAAEGKLRHEKDKLEKRRRTWKHHKGCACFARWTRHSLKQCLKDFNGLETASGNRFLVTHPIGSYDIIVYI